MDCLSKPKKAKSACAKSKLSSAACKPKCSRPGPITNNGYLNFLRAYRSKHCGLKPRELISKAARAWNCLPEDKKDRYRRQAFKVTTNQRHLRRPICQQNKNGKNDLRSNKCE